MLGLILLGALFLLLLFLMVDTLDDRETPGLIERAQRWFSKPSKFCPCRRCVAARAPADSAVPNWVQLGFEAPAVQSSGAFVGIAAVKVEAGGMVGLNAAGEIVPLRPRTPSWASNAELRR